MSRVVVVGGGFGGTAAAARLAKQGHQVTLVERLDRLGGAVGFVEREGYRWDAGPTSTALPAVVRDLFRKSGRPLERELELVPVEPMREHRFEDGTVLAMPSGSRSAQLEAVDATLGAGLGQQWVDHVHAFADTWDVLRRVYLERPWSPDHVDKASAALLHTRTTLQKVVTRTLKDERLREVALLPTRLDGHDPRNVPAWMGMWAYVEQNFGVWTVPGGMGRLAAAMTKRLGERKVEVLLGTSAVDLRVHAGRVVGVDTDRGSLDADVVVVAIDPRGLPVLAPHVSRTMPAIPPVLCHLGLSGDLPDLPHEVVLHGDPTLVVRTNGTAPAGGAAWTVLGRGRLSEDVTVALARRGIDVRRQIEVRVDRSPRDQVEELAGSAYGMLWQGRTTIDRKLAATPYAGVYGVGAHAAAGAGLPFVGLSAAVAAERIGPA
ncbi:FAD-dependent oxidoreductase [Nocardioides panacis]|uniref:FAD-dependent oxidoreductase n=1 Tax=Nocardioides panacis TaxID=2849501 RepID=A0A975SUV9_9ACTN|nr:FAD-dependent oxidoreductase [Nocardioides panacis]QWZ06332.1 FAD-dependent oxidoreductase [Nocardioides panacis]